MDEKLQLAVCEDPKSEDVQELIASLVAYNSHVAVSEEYRKLAVFIRDSELLVAGASGYTHWQWLFIGHLWVSEALRGSGLGTQVLSSIEEAAKQRGCVAAWLDTFSFQAKPFYLRHGYQEFGRLAGYPPGNQRHFLWKPLR